MTLAELKTFDVSAAWTRLTPEAQARIGEAAIAWNLADLVCQDDGSDTTEDDRRAAGVLCDDALYDGLQPAVEAALPDIKW